MTAAQLEYLARRGRLRKTGLTHDELALRMYRADQRVICKTCGKQYIDHPFADEARDPDNLPYLHVVCNGDIVKL